VSKKELNYEGFLGSIEPDLEAGILYGKILFVQDLVTYEADSLPQLKKEFEDAVDDYLETCKEIGKEPNKPFSGTLNVRIGPELHRRLAIKSHSNNLSLNESIKEAVTQYLEPNNIGIHHHIHRHIRVEQETSFTDKTDSVDEWTTYSAAPTTSH